MGIQSVVSGYILGNNDSTTFNKGVIAAHVFDEVYPFTNIFWCDSPSDYFFPVIGIAGSYKQVEEDWNEWMWKFACLLTRLEALGAVVNLDCIYGRFRWRLEPEGNAIARGPRSTVGERWGITEAPAEDFSLQDGGDWPKHVERWLDRKEN